jgi:hypothetical protein
MVNEIIADPRTGEVLNDDGSDEHFRPFAELLTILDRGAAHAEASRALHDLTAAVRDTGRKGSMSIVLQVQALKGSTDQLVVSAQVTCKPPKSEPAASIFYADHSGNLVRNDPRQPEIDGLRIVEPKSARVVGTEGK